VRTSFDFIAVYCGVNEMKRERNLKILTGKLEGNFNCQVKVKVSRYKPWRRLGERRYSSYSFSTSAPDGGE
jgi:hypothetical protein